MSYSASLPHHKNEASPPYVISISINVSGFTFKSTADTKVLFSEMTSPPFMSLAKAAFTLSTKLVNVLTLESYPSHRRSSKTQTQTSHHFRSPIFHLLRPITHILLPHLKPPRLEAVLQFQNSWTAFFSDSLPQARLSSPLLPFNNSHELDHDPLAPSCWQHQLRSQSCYCVGKRKASGLPISS